MSPRSKTAAEAKAECISAMGTELGGVFDKLWQELVWVHKKWDEYVTLFGADAETVELLNRAAPAMARTLQDCLWESILLHIGRLTDPPKSVGKDNKNNLSINRLAALLADTPIGSNVRQLADDACKQSGFVRDWRNRRLAHRDLDLALERHVKQLAPASRSAVSECLVALAKVLNAVSLHYLGSSTVFDVGLGDHGARLFLCRLSNGLRFEEERIDKQKQSN